MKAGLNVGLMIASLIVSVVLWIAVQLQLGELRPAPVTLRLDLVDLDPTKDLKAELVSTTTSIVVRGRPEEIDKLQGIINTQREKMLDAEVDLRDASQEVSDYPVRLTLPKNIQALDLEWPRLPQAKVNVSPLVSDVKDVVVDAINLPPNKQYTDAEINPSKVTLRGTALDLLKVGSVRAEIDLHGENFDPKTSYVGSIRVIAKDGHPITSRFDIVPGEVSVHPSLLSAPPTKNVLVSLQLVGQPAIGYRFPPGAHVTISPNQVKLRGTPQALTQMDSIETEPIDITGATSNVHKRGVKLKLPSGLSIVDGRKTVTVTIPIEKSPVATPPSTQPTNKTGTTGGL